ncbi:MAG TPA: hypothetical protein VFW12_06655 [Candidatus Limnocylindria bacterium]|nr:hypothetical protein [Candidatus Limnocylindria bacterium]
MSYDLRIVSPGRIDVATVRDLLLSSDGVEELGDELIWSGEAVNATFVLDPDEIGVGVTSGDAPRAVLRSEFLRVLELATRVAALVGAEVEDAQLGRAIGDADEDAVRSFAG